jgi:hypothetical protein
MPPAPASTTSIPMIHFRMTTRYVLSSFRPKSTLRKADFSYFSLGAIN